MEEKKATKSVENVEAANEATQQVEKLSFGANAATQKDVVRKLIASGCKKLNQMRIKNVNVTPKANYTMVSFTLSEPVSGYVFDEEENAFKLGVTNLIFSSNYAIIGALKEDEDLSWMANILLVKPDAMPLIFNGGYIDIVQQEVAAGEEYVNPFSQNGTPSVYDHNMIINHVVGFKLGKTGEKMADRLADKCLSFEL